MRAVAVVPWSFTLALASVGSGQQSESLLNERPGLSFRLDVDFIEVTVVVTDAHGDFVAGLERDDFEILEDGKLQEIAAFADVDLPRRPRRRAPDGSFPQPEVATNLEASGRLFVLLIDDLRTAPAERPKLLHHAREMVDVLGQDDLTAVIYTSGRRRSVGFTTDRATLLEALEPSSGRGPDDSLLDLRVGDIKASLGMIEGVAALLESVTGRRKAVVYFGPGSNYDLTRLAGRFDDDKDRSFEIMRALRATVGASNRGGVSIYGVDPQGLAAPSGEGIVRSPDEPLFQTDTRSSEASLFASRESLQFLAQGTGGFVVANRNDFALELERILNDNSRYYLLAYYPSNPKRDGKDRTIEVRVNEPSFRLRARKGYRAPEGEAPRRSPLEAPRGVAREVVDLLRSPVPIPDLPLRAVTTRADGSERRIGVAVEVDASALLFEEREGRFRSEVEIGVFLLGETGSIEEGSGRSAGLDLDTVQLRDLRRDGLRVLVTLPAAPGRYHLAVAARETRTGRSGLLYRELLVPRRDVPSVADVVLTSATEARVPLFGRERDRLLLVPATRREFQQSDELRLQIPHGLSGLNARVLREDGLVASEAAVVGSSLRLPLSELVPGIYFLELRAGADETERRVVFFRVLPAKLDGRDPSAGLPRGSSGRVRPIREELLFRRARIQG